MSAGEFRQYGPEWNRLESISLTTPWLACTLGAGLAVAKMFDRLSKFTIIQAQNSFFFAILDAFRRMGTGLLSVWMFNEALTTEKLLAFALTTMAIITNSLGDKRLKALKAQSEQQKSLMAGSTHVGAVSGPDKNCDIEMAEFTCTLHPEGARSSGSDACGSRPPPSRLDKFYRAVATL